MSLFSELKRRNVIRAGLAWLALSWLLLALAPVLVLSWMLEITPQRLRRDRGPASDNPENVRTGRHLDQITIVFVLLALGVSAVRHFVVEQAVSPPEPEVPRLAGFLPARRPPDAAPGV